MQSIKRSTSVMYNTTEPIKRKHRKILARYFKGVGSLDKNWIMIQKNYSADIIPYTEFMQAQVAIQQTYPLFQYECVSYNIQSKDLKFHSCADFDKADVPTISATVTYSTRCKKLKYDNTKIPIKHKWRLVKDDYTGFNVQLSYDLSRSEEYCENTYVNS